MELKVLLDSVNFALRGLGKEDNKFFSEQLSIFSLVVLLEKAFNSGIRSSTGFVSASTDELDSSFMVHEFIAFTISDFVNVKNEIEYFLSLGIKAAILIENFPLLDNLIFVSAFSLNNVSILKSKLFNNLAMVFVSDFSTVR
jgi:hypothetical protein